MILAAALLLAGLAPAPDPIAGRWTTTEGKALVRIAPCGSALCGTIVRVLKPTPGKPTTDVNNPEPARRNQPIEGLTILSGLVASGDWWSGKIYDPRRGASFTAWVRIEDGRLAVRGCLGPICKTEYWTRAG